MNKAEYRIGDETLILELGKVARQANGAVLAHYGGSTVLATVCCGKAPVEGLDYVPLSVDYNERYYAAGKIPGGFLKREARPKDKEILVSRLIDRPMRPLFHKSFGREIQIVPTVISTDQINPPDVVGMLASFAAVMVSDIPFEGPVSAIRVAAMPDSNQLVVNPTFQQLSKSVLDIVVAGGPEGVCMVEGGGDEISEELMLMAIAKAEEVLAPLCRFLSDVQERFGKTKLPFSEETPELEVAEEVKNEALPRLRETLFLASKNERSGGVASLSEELYQKYEERVPEEEKPSFNKLMGSCAREVLRRAILDENRRCDGRDAQTIRPIFCEVETLKTPHGSALFTRGETQSLGVVTLGSTQDEQIMDDIDGDRRSRFMLHYNFPPFSVGETGRLGTGRREIGHGHLAHRAIERLLPTPEEFPYTVRVVSEIWESNGSSSQATVCSASLALFDAGVRLRRPVAGIAMGLVKEGDRYAVLSDILGEEDFMGDMDFKVAGTEKGITSFQMDMKITGIDTTILKEALAQANRGRLHILKEMEKAISAPRQGVSRRAPQYRSLRIDVQKIGGLIGPGGRSIKGIAEKSGAKISVEEDGLVSVFGRNQESVDMAISLIRGIVAEPEVGVCYFGKVRRIVDFGAFIEFMPGTEGLCHISKISHKRIESVESVLKEGQEVKVRVTEIDRMGRVNLSMLDTE